MREDTKADSFVDIIADSKEFKNLLVRRSEELRIPLKKICPLVNVNWEKFRKYYLNSLAGEEKGYRPKQRQLINMAEILGVDVRVKLIILSEESYDGEKVRLAILNGEYEKPTLEKEGTLGRPKRVDTGTGGDERRRSKAGVARQLPGIEEGEEEPDLF